MRCGRDSAGQSQLRGSCYWQPRLEHDRIHLSRDESDTAVIESPAMCEPAHISSRIGKILMVPLPIVVGNARGYEGPPGTHCRYTQQEEE
jgi:hypothetical protein